MLSEHSSRPGDKVVAQMFDILRTDGCKAEKHEAK